MLEIEDWLQDPLIKKESNVNKPRKLRNVNNNQQDNWFSFHFATRLKLDGADYFGRQALGAASMPDDLGLPLLAHRLTEWCLEAFFFELVSSYETLLQELNVVFSYDLGLRPEQVRWDDRKSNAFMKKLPQNILKTITEERSKNWFNKLQKYRNQATHHYTIPLASGKAGFGEKPLDFTEHDVSMIYADKDGNISEEDITSCRDYLKKMVEHVSSVWEEMSQEFE
jgi:hypothetical protein